MKKLGILGAALLLILTLGTLFTTQATLAATNRAVTTEHADTIAKLEAAQVALMTIKANLATTEGLVMLGMDAISGRTVVSVRPVMPPSDEPSGDSNGYAVSALSKEMESGLASLQDARATVNRTTALVETASQKVLQATADLTGPVAAAPTTPEVAEPETTGTFHGDPAHPYGVDGE